LSTVNFDDQDWELAERAARSRADSAGVWKVALGVVAGIVVGGALVYAVDRRAAWQDAVERAPPAEAMLRGAGPGASAPQQDLPRLPTDPTRAGPPMGDQGPQTADEPPRAADAAQVLEQEAAERKAAMAQRAAQQAVERKERAWAMFYVKPPACDDNPTKATMVECANHFIRARREFELLYAAGKPGAPRQRSSANGSGAGPWQR
jgi:type IV secretory pathway VirB10-like protein